MGQFRDQNGKLIYEDDELIKIYDAVKNLKVDIEKKINELRNEQFDIDEKERKLFKESNTLYKEYEEARNEKERDEKEKLYLEKEEELNRISNMSSILTDEVDSLLELYYKLNSEE